MTQQKEFEEVDKRFRIEFNLTESENKEATQFYNFLHKELSIQHKKDIEWFKSIIPEERIQEIVCGYKVVTKEDRAFNDCREQILQELDKK